MKRNDIVRIKKSNTRGRIESCLPGGWYFVDGAFYEENELELIP